MGLWSRGGIFLIFTLLWNKANSSAVQDRYWTGLWQNSKVHKFEISSSATPFTTTIYLRLRSPKFPYLEAPNKNFNMHFSLLLSHPSHSSDRATSILASNVSFPMPHHLIPPLTLVSYSLIISPNQYSCRNAHHKIPAFPQSYFVIFDFQECAYLKAGSWTQLRFPDIFAWFCI